MKTKQKRQLSKHWLLLALLGVLLAAPNASIIRVALDDVNPFAFNAYRYAIVFLITLPLLIRYLPSFTRRNLRASVEGAVFMAIAVFTFVWAIKLSQASYVSMLALITPLVLILLSSRMIGEKISRRGMAGITLAAIGAMVIVILPVAVHQSSDFVFYPVATALALINCVTFPLATIRYRQANEGGLSFGPIMAITAVIIAVLHGVIGLAIYGVEPFREVSQTAMLGILYSGIVVGLLVRVIGVIAYERIGSVASGALAYLETLLAILLPVLWLNEKLSTEMVVGGILILIGVYIAEHHKSVGHKHFHLFRHH